MSKPQDRQWEVFTDPFHVDDDETLSYAIQESVILANRMGCGIVIAPKRREVAPDLWVTEGYVFKATYVPAVRYVEPEPEVELDEPVEAAA